MKIVCESCGAKYSIADDRVQGKVFKIRCKRCSEVIVVRGDLQAQPAAEAISAQTAAQDAIWHIVVEGEQAGPYSPAQLGEMLTAGAVDWDAYVWAEGFDNWVPMRDVEDLVAQITGQAQPRAVAQAAPAAYRPATQTLTGQPSMGADPFADDAPPSDPGLFGGGPVGGGPDLFARGAAQPASSPFGGAGEEPGLMTSSPSPRMSAERVMTGARNENSVLFSLKNLQALATGSGTPSAAPMASSSGGAGFASGEGSGLIDIRALATTTGIGDGSDATGHKDELLSLGSQGGAFGTLGSPMLGAGGDDSDGNKKTIIWAVVAGVGLVSAAFVAAAYILRAPPPAPAAPSVAVAPIAPAPVMPQPTQPPPSQAAAESPSEGELAAKQAAAAHEKSRESDKGSSSHSSGEHRKHGGGESSTAKAAPDEMAAPEVKKAPPKSGPRSIDDLLDGALSGSSSKPSHEADSTPKSDLPENPSKDQVLSAMGGVKPAVQACGKGGGGIATVTVNVAGTTGRVTNAEVNGVSGPEGSCIAQAVRKAQFPKFSKKVFKIAFPYKL